MWSESEVRTLRALTIDPARHSREKLMALVHHFQGGGTLYSVHQKGVPTYTTQDFARKMQRLVREGKLNWLVDASQPAGRPVPPAQYPSLPDPHWQAVLPTLRELKGIQPLVLHQDELTLWCFTDNHPCWPIAKGKACRDSEFNVTIDLDAETRVAWGYLQQHLVGDPIWDAIDSWKDPMARDLEARLRLLRLLVSNIQKPVDEGGLGLPAVADIPYGGCAEPALSWKYAFALMDQIMSQALGLNHRPHIRDSFRLEYDNAIIVGDSRVIWSPDEVMRESAITYFLDKQNGWVALPETQAAAEAYQLANEKTSEAERHRERLELAQTFPSGSSVRWL